MFTASTEQFKQLFAVVEGEGCSPMEGFLGSLAQLYQFVQQASHEKYQQIQPSVSITGLTQGSATSPFLFPAFSNPLSLSLSLCSSFSSFPFTYSSTPLATVCIM